MKRETPIGLALILCDTVIEDKSTNKKSLIGLFDRLSATQFPCVHPAMSIFISLTSGRGEYDAEIACRHADREKPAFAIRGKLRMGDPLQVVEVPFAVQQPRFEEAGIYWLELKIDDVPVMMRRLTLELRQPPPPGNPRN